MAKIDHFKRERGLGGLTNPLSMRKCGRMTAAVLVGFALSACVPSQPQTSSSESSGLSERTATSIWEAAMADRIVENCPSGFRYDQAAEDALVAETKKVQAAERESGAVFLSEAEFKRFGDAYFDAFWLRRGIQSGRPDTWCAAGVAEVSEKTQIGKLLIPR